MAKIKYDKETKILSIRLSNARSIDSDIQDNIVVDYDNNGNIVNVEIMSISLEEFKKANSYIGKIFQKEKTHSYA